MVPLRRRGLGALELALALALLAATVAWLPAPRPVRPDHGLAADALARRMERVLAKIHLAHGVLEPVVTARAPVSHRTDRLVLELPDRSRQVLRADSFQVRWRGPGVYLVRVRLVSDQAALFSAAEVGSWLEGSAP